MGAKEAQNRIRRVRLDRKVGSIDKKERRQLAKERRRYEAEFDRLIQKRDQVVPSFDDVLGRVPIGRLTDEFGIGPGTAEALERMGIRSAADLRVQLGRIEQVPGIGPGRSELIRNWVRGHLTAARSRVAAIEAERVRAWSQLAELALDHTDRLTTIHVSAEERKRTAVSLVSDAEDIGPVEVGIGDPEEPAEVGMFRRLRRRLPTQRATAESEGRSDPKA